MEEEEKLTCRVCSADEASRHFGSLCCSGCKGFFRRSVRFQKLYSCPREQNCVISKMYRNCCRACRYQKCLRVGLDPNLVQSDWGQSGPRARKECQRVENAIELGEDRGEGHDVEEDASEANSSPIPSSSHSSNVQAAGHQPNPPSSTASSASSGTELKFGEVLSALLKHYQSLNNDTSKMALGFSRVIAPYILGNAVSMARFFLQVEQFCDLFVDLGAEAGTNLEVPLEMALKKPGLVSTRSAICWDARNIVNPTRMLQVYARSVTHYFDWVSHMPDIVELSEEDKRRLVVKRMSSSSWLLIAQRSAKFHISGITLGVDCFFPVGHRQAEMNQRMVELIGPRMELATNELVEPIVQLGISEEEFALLRVVCFFTPVSRLSQTGQELILRWKNKYMNALVELVFLQRQHPSGQSPQWRMNRLMLMLAIAEQLGQMDEDMFQLLNVFNVVGLKGTLLYELHFCK